MRGQVLGLGLGGQVLGLGLGLGGHVLGLGLGLGLGGQGLGLGLDPSGLGLGICGLDSKSGTLTRSSVIGMSDTCLCLTSYR